MAAGNKSDPARNIVISSVGGVVVPHVGQAGSIAYAASKAAAHHLARNFAMELIPHNITTNTIAPGWFPTRLANPAIEKAGGEEVAGASNPTGRLGVPEDIAGVIVYLCSRAGRYINGEDITVDGGSRYQNVGVAHHIAKVREESKL
jgi:NAD(P)-dependent dehydrogenase (short-subunit alcohol dehydrogenase family)